MKSHYKPVIWLVNQYAYTPSDSASTRHHTFARALQSAGYRVEVVSSSYYHKGRRQRNEAKNGYFCHTDENGVPFTWIKTPSYQSNPARFWNMIVFGRHLHRRYLEKTLPKPDIIIATSPSPLAAFSAFLLSKRVKAKFVVEVVDIWPQTLIEVGRMSRRHPVIILLSGIERLLMKKADAIMTHLSQAHRHFIALGAAPEKCNYIASPIVVSDQAFVPRSTQHESQPFHFVHAGSLSASYCPSQVLDALAVLRTQYEALNTKIHVTFLGEGPLRAQLEKQTEIHGLGDCVTFAGVVPKELIIDRLRDADGFLLLAKDIKLHNLGISFNKIFDYMIAGRPVVVATNDEHTPISKAQSGVKTPPENPDLLAKAIWQVASMPLERRNELGAASNHYVKEHHSIESWLYKMEILISKLHDF